MPGTGDPFSPEDADPEADHTLPANERPPLERFARLGATPEDLIVAQQEWLKMTDAERHEAWIDLESQTDEEVAALIAQGRGSTSDADAEVVPEGTVEELLAWVGDDPVRASAALEHEQRRPRPRLSLLKALGGG